MVQHFREDNRRASLLPRMYHFAEPPAPPKPVRQQSAVGTDPDLTVAAVVKFAREALAEGYDPETPVRHVCDDEGRPVGLLVTPPTPLVDMINASMNPGAAPAEGEQVDPGQPPAAPAFAPGGPIVGQVTVTTGPEGPKVDEVSLAQAIAEQRARQSRITPRRPGTGPTRW